MQKNKFEYYEATLNSGFAMGLLVSVYYTINGLITSPQNFIPNILLYKYNQISDHQHHVYSSIETIILMSSIGAVGALTAWYTLLSEYNEKKGTHKGHAVH